MTNRCNWCGTAHTNGSRFCTRKCRKAKIKAHERKGAKKKYAGDNAHRVFGATFSNEDYFDGYGCGPKD